MKELNDQRCDIESMEVIISNYLRISVTTSAAVILCGLIMFLVTGRSGYPGDSFPITVVSIIRGLLSFKSYAVILTGLLLLVMTPVFRVGVSIITFLLERDYLYVVITSIVFIVLLIGFLLGKIA